MEIRELAIADAYEVTLVRHADERGMLLEWYHDDAFTKMVGHHLDVRQANLSVSRRGVLRGVHFADVPPGQAKLVTVLAGAVMDYTIDVRVGSPTFGQWECVLLDDVDRRAVYLSEGLGHAFLALTEGATVAYLVSAHYDPDREHAVSPLDPRLGLEFPRGMEEPLMSQRDAAAPTLEQAAAEGLLPIWAETRLHYESLNEGKT